MMKKVMLTVLLAIGWQAHAGVISEQTSQKSCFVDVGESTDMAVTWTTMKAETCYRCNWPYTHWDTSHKLQVEVPFGLGGTYIKQKYEQNGVEHTRVGPNPKFVKSGLPSGPNADEWKDWFPQETKIYIYSNSAVLLFKGKSLVLNCE